jgi:transposase
MEEETMARTRLSVILRVLSGDLTATQAAEALHVSRKTYYEWQERALAGMKEALTDRPAGRPPMPSDAEKEKLQEQIEDLSNQLELARKTIEVKNILSAFAAQQKSLLNAAAVPGKKKSGRKNP